MAGPFSTGFSAGFETHGSLVLAEAHGLAAGDAFYFAGIDPDGTGIDESAIYYVLEDGLTADAFTFSGVPNGTAFILALDIADGRIISPDAYDPVADGVMDPPEYPLPPAVILAEGVTTQDIEGKTVSGLVITLEPPVDPTIRTTWVKITTKTLGEGVPDWSSASIYPVDKDMTQIEIPGVLAGTKYYIITYSQSVYGTISEATPYVEVTPVPDNTAPAAPTGLVLAAALRGFYAAWDIGVVQSKDLAFYEVRYCLGNDDVPSGDWTIVRSKTTQVYVGGLDPLAGIDGIPTAKYWVQVRAVDNTGNVLVGGVAQDYLVYPNDGWCAAVAVNPTLVDADTIQQGSINPTHIDYLTADKIKTGSLTVSVADANLMDGITIKKDTDSDGVADTVVGIWDESGLRVYADDNPLNYVLMYDGGITVYFDGVPVTAIDPSGVNATSIKSGALPGGGNLVVNSSFELADFQTPSFITWTDDLTADFTATVVGADVNVTVANALTMTGVTY